MERSKENIESSHDAKIVQWSNENKYMYVYVGYIIVWVSDTGFTQLRAKGLRIV